ncbi:MAG: hypothetical protein LUF68_01710 [Clostridiales bacterium]|nr:hypothetical protein [Clostridiales bacterium]
MKNATLEIEHGVVRLNGKPQEDVTSITITIESLKTLTYKGEMVVDVETTDANGTETTPMLVNRITVDFPAKGAG